MPELVDNIDVRANQLAAALIGTEDLNVPNIDLSSTGYSLPSAVNTALSTAVAKLSNADITSGVVGGTGTFDALMKGFGAHLKDEFDKGRITGADYTKAYIALTESAMANAVQFLLAREQSFWQAQRTQIDAYTAKVQLEIGKMQYANARIEAATQRANYALSKIKLSNESMAFSTAKFQLEQIMPAEKAQVEAQTQKINTDRSVTLYQLSDILPQQRAQLVQQTSNLATEGQVAAYNLNNLLPKQLSLVAEQVEVQRAQTLNNRTDGAVVTGSIGKQKDLYTQQIASYQRDAEVKAAKLFTDAWITQKTIDEGLLAPSNFQNASVDTVLAKVKQNHGLT